MTEPHPGPVKAVIREASYQDHEALCDLIAEIDAFHREHPPYIFNQNAYTTLRNKN